MDRKGPETAERPFNATVTVMPTPWNKDTELLHIGIKGFDKAPAEQPAANLVFLIDVSGSMDMENRLGLVKESLRLLVQQLRPTDSIGLVVYGSNARVVLEHNPVVIEASATSATVLDEITNNSFYVDPETLEPQEGEGKGPL